MIKYDRQIILKDYVRTKILDDLWLDDVATIYSYSVTDKFERLTAWELVNYLGQYLSDEEEQDGAIVDK